MVERISGGEIMKCYYMWKPKEEKEDFDVMSLVIYALLGSFLGAGIALMLF